jgi:flagellar basal-body rod protein FlgB
MFIDKMINQGAAPVLEKEIEFTEARQKLLTENVVNASTPGYIQKDLSVDSFQKMLAEKVDQSESAPPGSVSFDDISEEVQQPTRNILFHDGNNRSMEQLMTDQAKNALMHNMAVELLRRQYATLDMAIKERPS